MYDHVFKVTFEGDTDACDKGKYIYCRSEKIRQMDSYLVVLLTVELYKREPLSSVIISVTAGLHVGGLKGNRSLRRPES